MSSDSPEIDKAYERLLKALQRAQGLVQDSAVSEQAVDTAPPSATEAVSAAPPAIPPQATPPQQPVVVPPAEDKTEHFAGSSIRKEPKRGDEKVGDIIDGRYKLEKELQAGGQGAVWRAKDLKTHRAIAIKLIFPKDKYEERALREPMLLRDLNHENIVEIRDIEIQKEQVSPYIAYEYIEGHDLYHVVHNSMPSIEQAATWCRDIARAMQHAHEKRVLHRDLKPENVMVQTSTNKIKVIDFGLGKAVPSLKNDEKSKSGDVSLVGTGRWFAPEQVFYSKATIATEIYQIGAILYFTLTREAPRDRKLEIHFDSPPDINSIRRVIGLPEVPPTLENICLQALKIRASERQATAQELADQLESFLGLNPGFAPQTSPWAKRTWTRRSVAITSLCLIPALVFFRTLAVSKRMEEGRDKQQGFSRLSAADFKVLKGSTEAIRSPSSLRQLSTGSTEIIPEGVSLIEFKPIPSDHHEKSIKSFTLSLEIRPLGDDPKFGIFLGSRKLGDNHIQQHVIYMDRLREQGQSPEEEPKLLVAYHRLLRLELEITKEGEEFQKVLGQDGHLEEYQFLDRTNDHWISLECTVVANHITSLKFNGQEVLSIINKNLLKDWLVTSTTDDLQFVHGLFVMGERDNGCLVRNVKRRIVYQK